MKGLEVLSDDEIDPMMGNNYESQTGAHPVTRVLVNPKVPISSLRERLEALRPRNRNGSHSQAYETNPLLEQTLSTSY